MDLKVLYGENCKIEEKITRIENLKNLSHINSELAKNFDELKNQNVSLWKKGKQDIKKFYDIKFNKSTNVKTLVFPGFPTDLQQPFMALATQCNGKSIIEETIYENRFMHIPYLNKMGANIEVNGSKAIINGPTKLIGTEVEATDLRAGASMVVAALSAEGTTIIQNIGHILRGYENIVDKLTDVGANIEVKEIPYSETSNEYGYTITIA